MDKVGVISPLRFGPPYTLEWRFSEPRAADEMAARPGAVRIDETTVLFERDDFFELPL
jgi:D-aminopeptidase